MNEQEKEEKTTEIITGEISPKNIKLNSSNDMCNALTNDCTIVLKPNWKTNTYILYTT